MHRILVSDTVQHERLAFEPQHGRGAQAFPGWKTLSLLYQASFEACGFRMEQVLRPEVYQAGQARALLGIEAGDWHLAVKPIEHLRPFHGLPNVFVCDWPFPELSSETLGGSPFFDQVRLLRQADAVLCPTAFTTGTLRRAGVERAITLPPCVPARAGFQEVRTEDGPCRFLCVVDQENLCRELGATLEGFAAAAAERGDLRLHVSLRGSSHDVAALKERAAQAEAGCGSAPAITVEADAGPGWEPGGARFFLSAHAAPGLHIPLAEAMGAGLPVVTTVNVGTASFLPPGAAVPIEAHADTLDGQGEPIGRFMPLTSHPATAGAVRDAVLAAAALDGAARARMTDAARTAAVSRFGPAAFREGLARLEAMLPGRPG